MEGQRTRTTTKKEQTFYQIVQGTVTQTKKKTKHASLCFLCGCLNGAFFWPCRARMIFTSFRVTTSFLPHEEKTCLAWKEGQTLAHIEGREREREDALGRVSSFSPLFILLLPFHTFSHPFTHSHSHLHTLSPHFLLPDINKTKQWEKAE